MPNCGQIVMSNLFSSIDISASGLSTERTRMNLISENIANAQTTRSEDGGPYRRKLAVVHTGVPGERFSRILQKTQLSLDRTQQPHYPEKPFERECRCGKAGVHVSEIVRDPSPFRMVYDPHHPDANQEGYVAMPNVNIVQEMTSLISATRTYEANITAIQGSKQMIREALKI